MTRKPSNLHSHENTSDKARHGRKGLTPARRMRRADRAGARMTARHWSRLVRKVLVGMA